MENIMAESAVKVNIIGGMVLKKQLAGLSFTATPPSCEVRLRTSHAHFECALRMRTRRLFEAPVLRLVALRLLMGVG